ncbi:hypothetical protein IJJ97_07010 [bacterium]|nr:hypothetical protein [bacterium]
MSIKKVKDYAIFKKILSYETENDIDFSELFSFLNLILNIIAVILILQKKDFTVLILLVIFADLCRGVSLLYSKDKRALKFGLKRLLYILKYGFVILLFIPVYKYLNGSFLLSDFSENFIIKSVPLFFISFLFASIVKLDFLDEFDKEFLYVSKNMGIFLILGKQFEVVSVLLLLSLFYVKFSFFAYVISFCLLFSIYFIISKFKFINGSNLHFLYNISIFLGFLNIVYLIFLKS